MCHWKHLQEIGRKKSVRVQALVGLHVSLRPPAVNGVGEMQWQSPTADRLSAGIGTCANSNGSLHATNGMWPTGFKSIDTNRCVCKGP
ncbi:hypothetical protein AVEN_235055-1 [Araneus ventricosus]|uniref:Uncharacterized protein n=1 Tax=Araneus ventricosus TaxID=182803 RepID=A0A4Y2EXY9_ARAVE|nr:hypothetical protein AVEN_235055-1 [Araneus ventricosus]